MRHFYILPLREPKCAGNCVCDDEQCAAGCSTWASANSSMNSVDNGTEKDPQA